MEASADFIKNAGLVTLLNFLFVPGAVLIAIGCFCFVRTSRGMRGLLLIGIVPLFSGILALYFKYKYAAAVMFGVPTPQTIAANQREGLIDLAAGVTGSIVILFLGGLRQRLSVNSNG